MRRFEYGERLRFPARISPPRNYRNPGAFDYQGYLSDNGIVALASTKAASIEVLPGFAGSRAELWRSRIHRSIIEKVHALWPLREAALMDAMVIGEDAFINRPTRADFQRSGTYHVLVVSGMNVSILALVTFWFLRRLRVSDLLAGAITVSLMVAYAVLTGLGSPVWRATLMLAIYLGARLLYREKSMLNSHRGRGPGPDDRGSKSPVRGQFPADLLVRVAGGGRGYTHSGADDAALSPRLAAYRFPVLRFRSAREGCAVSSGLAHDRRPAATVSRATESHCRRSRWLPAYCWAPANCC